MLNWAIRFYYIAMPTCMILQTVVLALIARQLGRIRTRRSRRKRLSEEELK